MIHVVATIEVAEGRRDDFLEIFNSIVSKTRAEEGCLEYGPTVDVATDLGPQLAIRENVVTVVEKWESIAALQAHLAADHMTDMRERAKGIIQGLEIQVLEPAT